MRTTPIIVAALAGVAILPPASAATASATIAEGAFQTLGGGADLGYQVEGTARMVRSGDRTIVVVHVAGLESRTTYPAHVHDQPCSALPAGGAHYRHDPDGPVDPDNEIWPTVRTGPTGLGLGVAVHRHIARDDARAIVIHYPADTSIRLACADLD